MLPTELHHVAAFLQLLHELLHPVELLVNLQVTTPRLIMSYSWKMIRPSAKSEYIQFL